MSREPQRTRTYLNNYVTNDSNNLPKLKHQIKFTNSEDKCGVPHQCENSVHKCVRISPKEKL